MPDKIKIGHDRSGNPFSPFPTVEKPETEFLATHQPALTDEQVAAIHRAHRKGEPVPSSALDTKAAAKEQAEDES